jgi:putative NADPH-quinone reductase
MNSKIKIEITEMQRILLIDYVCDYEIEKWVKKGRKLANNKYRLSVTYGQVEEMIEALQYLALKADNRSTRKQLTQLANQMEEHMLEEF